MVINPFQQEIMKQIQGIVEFNGVNGEDLYFAPLIPFGFLAELMDDAGAANAQEIIENPNDVPDLEAEQAQPTDQDMAPNPDETIGDVVGPENVGVQGLSEDGAVNENLKNLSGRQYQQLLRIVNQFQKGKINEAQAALMLMSAFGFSDTQAKTMLGIDTNNKVEMSKYNDVDWKNWKIEN
jgi:hypothetical protein